VLLGIPLALPEDLKARAVQHDMNGPVIPGSTRLTSRKGAPPSAQGRMVRHAEVQPEQAQNRARETFDLT